MGLWRNRRINKLIDKHISAGPAERAELHNQIRDLMVEGRSEAARDQDYREYCVYSIWLGQLFADSRDPSDALRPFGCAYITACAGGDSLNDLKAEAADGLAKTYARFGEFELAGECAADAGMSGADIDLDLVLFFFANVHRASDKRVVSEIYQLWRSDLHDGPPWAQALAAIIDDRFGIVKHNYESLVAKTKTMVNSHDDAASLAHRVLAEAALAEGRTDEAEKHAIRSLHRLPVVNNTQFLGAPVLGLAAQTTLINGRPDEAFNYAMRGWASVIPDMLECKDDFARDRFRWMISSCIDVALEVAHNRRDWNLMTELIENSRLQVGKAAPASADEEAVAKLPDWIATGTLKALGQGAIRGGVHALSTDWKSGKRKYAVVKWRGKSSLLDAVAEHWVGKGTHDVKTTDAHYRLREQFESGAIAWFAAVRNGVLFWTLSDISGSFDGGRVDLNTPAIANALSALQDLVLPDAQPSDPSNGVLRGDGSIDALNALSSAGSDQEFELMTPLSKLLPDVLKINALRRSAQNPLRVLMAVPAELSAVPWAAVPIERQDGADIRLIERMEPVLLTPTIVRVDAPSPTTRATGSKIAVSCWNPDGNLIKSNPVIGEKLLIGGDTRTVTVSSFLSALQIADRQNGALFIRSHLGSSSTASYIADRGILFSDGVLSARDLALTLPDGSPAVRLPNRVILSMCSGAGSADVSGLSLGLAAACRLSGAEEVIASLFDVPDTTWGCDFDHQIATLTTASIPLANSLRVQQLNCLDKWRTTTEKIPGEGPTPLVWAAFMAVY